MPQYLSQGLSYSVIYPSLPAIILTLYVVSDLLDVIS